MQAPITALANRSRRRFRRWAFLPLGVLALAGLAMALTLFGGGGNPASAQQASTTFTTFATGNSAQKWIWSDGTTMYVSDSGADKVFAYNMGDKQHNSSQDFGLDAASTDNTGIWGNDATLYVADAGDDKIYAYNRSDMSHDSGNDIPLHAENGSARGIWSDGTTMWVADVTDDIIYAYTISSKARDSSKDINISGGAAPMDLWSDGTIMWVSSDDSDVTRAYSMPGAASVDLLGLTITPTLDEAGGIWSDGTYLWLANTGTDIARYFLPLPRPANFEATASGTSSRVTFTWDRSYRGDGYLLQWGLGAGSLINDAERTGIEGLSTTSHSMDLRSFTEYRFWLKTISDGDGETGESLTQQGSVILTTGGCHTDVTIGGGGSYSASGAWTSDCGAPSGTHEGSYSRFYTFDLAERREVRVGVSAGDKAVALYLREGDPRSDGYSDDYLAAPTSTADADVYKALDPGTYTVEVVNLNPGETGRFTLSINTRTLTAPPATTGDVPASCHTVSLTAAGTYQGQWGPGPADTDITCRAATVDGYARYYEFHLTSESRVTITLTSNHATPRVFMREKRHPYWQIKAGAGNEDRRTYPHYIGAYSSGGSRISETLPPGSYTIQAGSNEAGQMGDFTLQVSGSGIGAVPALPASVLCADTPNQTLSAGTETTGQWGPGCESGTAYVGHFARFYSFTVPERKSVTVTLKDKDIPGGDYGVVLRRDTDVEKIDDGIERKQALAQLKADLAQLKVDLRNIKSDLTLTEEARATQITAKEGEITAKETAITNKEAEIEAADHGFGAILGSAFNEGNQASLTMDLQEGTYHLEALGGWPSEFTIAYTLANPSAASDCYGRRIGENEEVNGRWFSDCTSTGTPEQYAAYYDLRVSGAGSKRVNIRLHSSEAPTELLVWNASDFTGSGANRTLNSGATVVARHLHADKGHNLPAPNRKWLHEDLPGGNYVIEARTVSASGGSRSATPSHAGVFRLGVTTGVELPDDHYERENCGEVKYEVRSDGMPLSVSVPYTVQSTKDGTHTVPGDKRGDKLIRLGQNHDKDNLDNCTGDRKDGFPVWHFVFDLDGADTDLTVGVGRESDISNDRRYRWSSSIYDLTNFNTPTYTLRQLGGERPRYASQPDGPMDKYFEGDPNKAPVVPCPTAGETPPCLTAGVEYEGLTAGTYALTVTMDPPPSDPSRVTQDGPFSVMFTTTAGFGFGPEGPDTGNPPPPDLDTFNPPVFSGEAEDQTARLYQAFSYTVPEATDPKGGDVTYTAELFDGASLNALPEWLSFDAATRTFSGTPEIDDYPAAMNIVVTAGDDSHYQQTDSTVFTLTVDRPAENLPPMFQDGEEITFELAENSPMGTEVGTPLTAFDANGDALAYLGFDGADGAAFALGADGQLTTIDGVDYDYEEKSSYQFMALVMETDTELGHLSGIWVTVNLTNVNEAPAFATDLETTLSVAEDSPAGTSVGDAITATDPEGDTLTYSLVGFTGSETDASAFEIGSSTGQITTKSGVTYDRDTKSSYMFFVTATEQDTDEAHANAVVITVKLTEAAGDANGQGDGTSQQQQAPANREPAFDAGIATTLTLDENSPATTSVGKPITATDPDEGDTVTYSLSGMDAASFDIGSSTGQITTKTNVTYDFETKSSYSLSVNATDGKLTASTPVTVNLNDVNEAPVFAGSSTTRKVAENSAAGTSVGTAVTATDPDANDTLTYSLSGTDAASFAIGSSTGQITTKSGVTYDYETKSSYSLAVKASDAKGLSDSIDVTVSLTDVEETASEPEAPANQDPAFDADLDTSLKVPENSAGGVNVGSPITATDPDEGDTLAYSLSGDDAASFAIGSSNGQITTKAGVTYDYESKSSYSLAVDVSDGNGGTDSIAVTVSLNNVNEAPAFADGTVTTLSVEENSAAGTKVGSAFAATDPDSGDTLAFSLSGDDAASFDIGSSTGQITTKSGVNYDYEAKSSYSFTVEATDAEGLLDSIDVTVNLNDVAEATPVTECRTTTSALSAGALYSGTWDDSECKAHHQDSRARYLHFTVATGGQVTISLSAGTLYVSKGTPNNGWGTAPKGTYEHRREVRRTNGKLLHDGAHTSANTVTLSLAAGTTYTVEAAGTSGDFTVSITPQ